MGKRHSLQSLGKPRKMTLLSGTSSTEVSAGECGMSTEKESLPDFSEKTVLFYIGSKVAGDGLYLVSPRFEIQGSRLFVVGTLPVEPSDSLSGAVAAVAWDQVNSYVVANSIEQFDAPPRVARPA
jgi:hypothetical protein